MAPAEQAREVEPATGASRVTPDPAAPGSGAPSASVFRPSFGGLVERPSSEPAPAASSQEAPLVPSRSADDSNLGWHEGEDSNDERLRRDVPPHWG